MNIAPASQNNFTAAIRLLQSCGQPTEDISPGTQLFVMEADDKVIGTVAVEYDYDNALIRNLSVTNELRNQGIGQTLVNFAEDYVRKQGVQKVFLLTADAIEFFLKRGYQKNDRNKAPAFIQNTSAFRSVTSACILKKEL